MLTNKPQAIAGVSPEHESVVEELYPSIADTPIGKFIHRVLESIPTRIWGLRISHLLFGLPVAPLAASTYLWLKVFGSRYVLTNRAIKRLNSLGHHVQESVPLGQIASASVDPDSRLEFYRSGDVRLTNAAGQTVMLIRGVPVPDRFCQVIQESIDAKRMVESSMAQIAARH